MQVNITPNFVPNIPKKSPSAVNNSGASKLAFGRAIPKDYSEVFALRDEVGSTFNFSAENLTFIRDAYRNAKETKNKVVTTYLEDIAEMWDKTKEEVFAGIK